MTSTMENPDYDYNPDKDRPVAVSFGDNDVIVTLADGRRISNPLDWHPWLATASDTQRNKAELGAFSVYWPDLDEGLDIEGMLRGVRPKARAQF